MNESREYRSNIFNSRFYDARDVRGRWCRWEKLKISMNGKSEKVEKKKILVHEKIE